MPAASLPRRDTSGGRRRATGRRIGRAHPGGDRSLYPRAPEPHVDAFVERHPALFRSFGIAGGRNRLHFFLAQIGHESAGLTIAEERLHYSAARLMAVWPARFRTLAAAQEYARQPEKLANHVYANRMGNGDAASGDGWRHRGRGYAQITGRDAYAALGEMAQLDLLGRPEQAAQPQHALRVACAFWVWKKLDASADRGDFIACVRRWNGGTIGMDDRLRWLSKVQRVVRWSEGAPPAEAPTLDRATVLRVQQGLRERGLYRGSIDGILGRLTRAGVRAWPADHDLPVTGVLTRETLESLLAERGASHPS